MAENRMEHEPAFPGANWCGWCEAELTGSECPMTQEKRDAEVARIEKAIWGPTSIDAIGYWIGGSDG